MFKAFIIFLGILAFFSSFGGTVMAKSMDIQTLQSKYPARHFDEIQLPSGITHYQSTGNGPVIILVHGVSGPLAVWDKNVDALVAAGYKVVRYDLYGRGFSSRLETAPYDLNTYETQLSELIETLHLGPNIRLVGSSLGGIITSEYTIRHPQNISGLVLIGPAGFPITVPLTGRLRDFPVIGDIFTYFFAYNTILKQNDNYFVNKQMPEDLRPFVADQLSVPGTTSAIARTMKNSPVQSFVNSYQKLGQTGVQVGLIWGREDAIFPYENSKILLEAAPQASLVTIENAGHIPQYERAEEVTSALINFEKSFK
jgi:pimeloyl-ACP methyl ester carboxylesterase